MTGVGTEVRRRWSVGLSINLYSLIFHFIRIYYIHYVYFPSSYRKIQIWLVFIEAMVGLLPAISSEY